MKKNNSIYEAKEKALEVILHNINGPFQSLPRTAGWGYPEPYTRDLMISSLGILASGNEESINSLRNVLEVLAKNQTKKGHIPSLVHDPGDIGARDTTPWFLIALALYRKVKGDDNFLEDAAAKSLTWMSYQSPDDGMITQLPTTDWRDEQWVLGYGLYVNTLVFLYRKLFGKFKNAQKVRKHINSSGGLFLKDEQYYALWKFKVYQSQRFDLLGNSLAIISGIASKKRGKAILDWVIKQCTYLQKKGELMTDLPPNFFPFIKEKDSDWLPRYKDFNLPGEYHNGGIWPFISGFFVVALLAVGYKKLAEKYLLDLTDLVQLSREPSLAYGFNEWIKAQNGEPMGQDWQLWSAAMYLYAAECVEKGKVLFLT